MIFFNNI